MMEMVGEIVNDSVSVAHDRLTTLQATLPTSVLDDLRDLGYLVTVRPRTGAEAYTETSEMEFIPDSVGCSTVFGEKRFVGLWRSARRNTLETVEHLLFQSAEPVNDRIIENLLAPFSHSTILITSTDWGPLQRMAALPETRYETRKFWDCVNQCMLDSKPFPRPMGEWHLPYVDEEDLSNALMFAFNAGPAEGMTEEELERRTMNVLRRMSVARCARVSELLDGRAPTVKEDLDLFEQLSAWPRVCAEAGHSATPKAAGDPRPDGIFSGWRDQRTVLAAGKSEELKSTATPERTP